MSVLSQDIRYGFRTLLRESRFTATVVFTIALGIGATTVIFSAINAVLLRVLPFEEPDRIVMIWATQDAGSRTPVAPANMSDWRKQNQVFDDVGGFVPQSYNLTGMGEPERIQGALVSAGLLSVLHIKPIQGRTYSDDEDRPGAERVVMISEKLWQRRFGGDPGLVGKPISLSGDVYNVIGILPPSLDLLKIAAPAGTALDDTELWVPLGLVSDPKLVTSRGTNLLRVIARLKPGVSMQQAQADMNVIASQLETQYPATNTGQGVKLATLYDEIVGRTGTALWILFGAVAFVLLIACANVANLLLIRSLRRHKEISIRVALGASPGRLIKQLLTESIILSLIGGALGVLLAYIGVRLLPSISPRNIIRLDQIDLDIKVLVFAFAASVLTGIIFGLMPAFQITKFNMNESLKEGSRGSTDTRQRVRSLLVSFEVAMTMVLLIGAGLLIKTILGLMSVDPGFRTENVLTMRVLLSQTKYTENQQWLNFFNDAKRKIEGLPGVQSVSLINNLPLSGTGANSGFNIEGRPEPSTREGYMTGYRVISPNYLDTMGIGLKKGRQFSEQDTGDSPKVVIINEAMARRFWPADDPIGKRVAIGRDQVPGKDIVWREVIGTAGNVKHWGLMDDAPPEAYVPVIQSPTPSMFLVVHSASDPTNLISAIRREILSLDKDQPIYSVKTVDELLLQSISQLRFYMMLLSIFAGIALIITMVGMYGLLAYSINQRKQEIGIRLALGAQQNHIIKMVLAQGMKVVLIGIAVGVVAAIALTRLMASLLYGVSSIDPLTYIGVSLLLALVALGATYFPARTAAGVDPAIALRAE